MKKLFIIVFLIVAKNCFGQIDSLKIKAIMSKIDSVKYELVKDLFSCKSIADLAIQKNYSEARDFLSIIGTNFINKAYKTYDELQKLIHIDSQSKQIITSQLDFYSKFFLEINSVTDEKSILTYFVALKHMDYMNKALLNNLK